jgi:putative flavoprotein involved in K+ transport
MATIDPQRTHYPVVIVGAGQAGLSLSYYLNQADIDHLIVEKRSPVHTWRTQRWDSFSLVTPNWQCDLPGWPYKGDDPHGFMLKDQINEWLKGFVEMVDPPVLNNTEVLKVKKIEVKNYFEVKTTHGDFTANQVVIASGGYLKPIIPRFAERFPQSMAQIHSAQYSNPNKLPNGPVLVVGSGQSGSQIAEDLHLAGRKVFLATGDAPRCARFYRGKDVVDWLAEMNYYEMPVTSHPLKEGVRDNTNHYVTGRDGGRDIDLRKFALEGMELFGLMTGLVGEELTFMPNLKNNLDHADAIFNGINASIDKFIESKHIKAPPASVYEPVWTPTEERTKLNYKDAGIKSIVWCIGFSPDFTFVDSPVFNGKGEPVHTRGITNEKGLYFLGLPWLHTWGSGRFSGVARDAKYLHHSIVQNLNRTPKTAESVV